MINVTGTTNKKLLAYIERVSAYLGVQDVDIDIVKSCAADAGGYCDGDAEWCNIEIARNDAVGKIPMYQLMINIAHEMVHASQILTGRLVNKGMVMRYDFNVPVGLSFQWIWEGNVYTDVAYDDHPWEIEAYELEEKVYNICK